jgi:hypothetical protein
MGNKGDEVHTRFSGDPVATGDWSRRERKSGSKERSRVVIPQLRHHNQRIQVGRRKNAEISDPNLDPSEDTMNDLVQPIEDTKNQRFCSAASFCEYCSLAMIHFRKRSNELQCPLGSVLAIGIHDKDRVASDRLCNVSNSNRDGPLVAKVATKAEYADNLHNQKARLKILGTDRLIGSIIDDQNIQNARIST